MDGPDSPAGPPGGLAAALQRLTGSFAGLVRTRLALATVEFAEERERIRAQLALLIAGVGLLLFAAIFAAFFVVVYFWDSHRLLAIGAIALLFAVVGVLALWRRAELVRTAPTPFAATLAELDRDRAAIAAAAQSRRPPT